MAEVVPDGGLEKARIRVENGQMEGRQIHVLFNPTEYRLSKRIQYGEQDIAGLMSPVVQFVSGDAKTLSMELFFDTSEERSDVTAHTDELDSLLTFDPTLGAPPVCQFVWGESLQFKAVLESAEKQFTRFLPTGTPVRARVDVTFKEYQPASEQQKTKERKPGDKTKTRTVKEGDTLWAIAKAEYGDANQWRRIASANGIEDPRTLQPGTVLTIPPRQA